MDGSQLLAAPRVVDTRIHISFIYIYIYDAYDIYAYIRTTYVIVMGPGCFRWDLDSLQL